MLRIVEPERIAFLNARVNLVLAEGYMLHLARLIALDTQTPILQFGPGVAQDADTYGFDTFALLPLNLGSSVDEEGRVSLSSSSLATVSIAFTFENDSDTYFGGSFPLSIHSNGDEPLVDVAFDEPEALVDTSTFIGATTVEEACNSAVEVGGTVYNLLDLLDGSYGDVAPPILTPPCSAGSGPDNFPPTIDLDKNGVPDAYRVVIEWRATEASIL